MQKTLPETYGYRNRTVYIITILKQMKKKTTKFLSVMEVALFIPSMQTKRIICGWGTESISCVSILQPAALQASATPCNYPLTKQIFYRLFMKTVICCGWV